MPTTKKTASKSQGSSKAQHAEAGKQSHKTTATKAGDKKASKSE